jgi:hypothetical protein
MRRSLSFAVALAVVLHIAVSTHDLLHAQSASMQSVIGPNQSVVAGIKDQFVGDMFRQRQNEAVSCVFAVNPDQQIYAYNDYRTVDIANDGQVGTPTPIQRSLFAKLFAPFRKAKPAPAAAEPASAQAWIGLSFTDNGTDFYTGLHPASPFSPPVAGDEQLAGYHFQAASDPVFAATPTHCLLAGIAFTPGGLSAGFISRFSTRNDSENRSNVRYDWSKVVLRSPSNGVPGGGESDFFVDKPYIAAGANGKVVVAFVLFDESDPLKLASKVVVYTSNDYGDTWSTQPVVVSQPLSRNQAPWILIDPNNENTVYIGWRVFSNPKYPTLTNAIVGKKSTDGGRTFQPAAPYPVALLLRAYDAPQTNYPAFMVTPRSNAYPTAVIDAQGTLSVFIQEYVNPSTGYPLSPFAPNSSGQARITQTNSYNGGVTWTLRRAIDYGPGTGPQFMPAAAVTGVPGATCPGKPGPRSRIAVMYYDARASYPDGATFNGGGGARFDVRVAQSDPCFTDSGSRPIFSPSQQVSRYTLDGTPAHKIVTTPGFGYPAVNAIYRIFNSTQSFFTGDYIHITPKIQYVLNGGIWKSTTAASVTPASLPSPVFKGSWADTRDIHLPTYPSVSGTPGTAGFIDALPWQFYLPPNSGVVLPDSCSNAASRDQNPYMAEISDGLYAAAPVTFRNSNAPRAFPLYVENRTSLNRLFRLTIQTGNAQFNLPPAVPDTQSDVAIGKFSTLTGSVLVNAGITSPVTIRIQEITAAHAILAGGLTTTVTLNTAGETSGAPSPTENRTPALGQTPIVTKPFGTVPAGGVTVGPNGPNPYPNPFGENPFGENPFGENPFGENPFGENPFGENTTVYDVTDVTFSAQNAGDKTASYSALLSVLNFNVLKAGGYKFQSLIMRASRTPGLNGCQTIELIRPNQISNIKTPKGSTPFGENPFGENPFGENPFGENPFGENPFGENPFGENGAPTDSAVSNSTFYLAPAVAPGAPSFRDNRPQDFATYTLRVFQTVPNPATVFSADQVSVAVVAHEPNVVPNGNGGFVFELTPSGTPKKPAATAGAQVPAQLAFTTPPTSTLSGAPISPAIVVAVRDVFGNTVPGYNNPVTLSIGNNPSDGTLSGTTTRSAVNGIATFPGLSINRAGPNYTLVASTGALSFPSQVFDITLPPPSANVTVLDTDVTAAGRGAMRGNGVGTMSLAGVTGTVTRALLYWHGPTNSESSAVNATVTFAGHPVTGANFGITDDNEWGMLNSQSYGADVTWLVPGNGNYSLSNFRKVGQEVLQADINGASLIVFFNDGNVENNRDVYLLATNDSTWSDNGPTSWTTSLSGITYGGGTALLQLHVADGQGWGDGGLYLNSESPFVQAGANFQGNSVPPTEGAEIEFGTTAGGLWDIKSYVIPQGVLTTDGLSSVNLFSPGVNDALSIVVMLVNVPHVTPIGQPVAAAGISTRAEPSAQRVRR